MAAPDDDDDNNTDFHRNFVFSENIHVSEGGNKLIVNDQFNANLLRNLIQYTKSPLSHTTRYFKAFINLLGDEEVSSGQDVYIMFGLNGRCFIGSPQWKADQSIRYHSNNGGIFNGGPGIRSDNSFEAGDEVACYLAYIGTDRSLVHFFKQQELVFRQWVNLPADQLYATIGFAGCPIEVSVQWPRPTLQLEFEVHQDDLEHWIGFKEIQVDSSDGSLWLEDYDDCERLAFSKQAPCPLSKENSYYEIYLVIIKDSSCSVGMGVTGPVSDKFRMPGWDMPSIGYHADDGAVFYGSGEGTEYQDDEVKCVEGDRMGCGLIFLEDETCAFAEQAVIAYFTKNGQIIHHKCVKQPEGGFYPTVGFCTKGDRLRINTKLSPPHIEQEVVAEWSVGKTSLSYFRYLPTITFINFEETRGSIVFLREGEKKHSLVQFVQEPVDMNRPYFSITISDIAADGLVWMGLSTVKFPQDGRALGVDAYSCGYKSKDGQLLVKDTKITSQSFTKGDEIGCYLEHISNNFAIILFMKNGSLIGRVHMGFEMGEKLYASVVMKNGPVMVCVEWPDLVKDVPQITDECDTSNWIRPVGVVPDGKSCLECKEDGDDDSDEAWLVTQSPTGWMHDGEYYFEFTIKISLDEVIPGIGLCTVNTPCTEQLGASKGGWAFYPSSKDLYMNKVHNQLSKSKDFTWLDRFGCGVTMATITDLRGQEMRRALVYFTVNGDIVYHHSLNPPTAGFYPCVVFQKHGTAVELLMTAKPPTLSEELNAALWHDKGESHTLRNTLEDEEASAMLAGQMLADVVNYTSVIVDSRFRKRPSSRSHGNIAPATERSTIYISHAHHNHDVEKAQSMLQSLSENGYIVEMSIWNPTLETVNTKADNSDIIIVCLSQAYYTDNATLHEFIVLKSKGKPVIPVILDNSKWPPSGNLLSFRHDFDKYEKNKLDFSVGQVKTEELIEKIGLCWREVKANRLNALTDTEPAVATETPDQEDPYSTELHAAQAAYCQVVSLQDSPPPAKDQSRRSSRSNSGVCTIL